MPAIDILIPSYRELRSQTRQSLLEMMRWSQCKCGTHAPWQCPKGQHDIIWQPPLGSCVIHWARNQQIALGMYGPHPDNRPPADYFLLMDDDMTVSKGMLNRLVSHKKDIVAGICTVRRDPPIPTIRYWDDTKEAFVEPIEWDWTSQKLIEIDASGSAFMLVSRKVLEKMGEAHLDCHFERLEDKRKGLDAAKVDAYWDKRAARRRERFNSTEDWQKKDCWWFQFLDNIIDSQIGEVGEDLSFCWKAKRLGFKVYADPQVTPGHLGEYAYSVDDYIELTRRWKSEGRHIERNDNMPQLGPALNVSEPIPQTAVA